MTSGSRRSLAMLGAGLVVLGTVSCASAVLSSPVPPGLSVSGLIESQVGIYTFAYDWTLGPPAAGESAGIDRATAIALATPLAELASADVATATPSVSYGILLDGSRTRRAVVDVRFLDVVGLGPQGGPASSVSEPPVPARTPHPLDINVFLDPVTGSYLGEVDESAATPVASDDGLIPPQAGTYTFNGGGATLSPPPAGSVALVSRTAAIASATRQADLEADVRTTTASVSYGLLVDAAGSPKLVVDVRWLDVLGLGGLGGPGPDGSSAPISTNSPQDINVILDATTGSYLEEMDDGRG